jgi:hypothetical protein
LLHAVLLSVKKRKIGFGFVGGQSQWVQFTEWDPDMTATI